jgi:hypothetical protein
MDRRLAGSEEIVGQLFKVGQVKPTAPKIKKWADCMLDNPHFVVVWFEAGNDENQKSAGKALRELLPKVLASHPSFIRNRLSSRFFIAHYRDLWPAIGEVNWAAFRGLSSESFTTAGGQLAWLPFDVLDSASVPFVPGPGFDKDAILSHRHALYGVPVALRGEPSEASDFVAEQFAGTGLSAVPVLPRIAHTARGFGESLIVSPEPIEFPGPLPASRRPRGTR